MADAPLTEKRFIELFELLFEKKIAPIRADIKELKGFVSHESSAIEYELQQKIEEYLTEKYPSRKLEPFGIKRMDDPKTDEEITELDAAFIIKPYNTRKDYARLKEHKLPFPSKEKINEDGLIFVLAEAKHYIEKSKIKEKLFQFDRIRTIFLMAKKVVDNKSSVNVSEKFIKTVQHHKFLSDINETILIFGASAWEKRLLIDFTEALDERKQCIEKFIESSGNQKINIYKQICQIEQNWYESNQVPNDPELTDDAIMALDNINGAMSHVKLIKPSGNRFSMSDTRAPSGIIQYSLKGGKTRRKERATSAKIEIDSPK